MIRRTAVLIADDHPLVSQGLRAILRPNCDVVGVVQDGRDVIDAVRAKKPDLLLLDLSMPHRNGLDLLPELVKGFPALKVLIVTMHVDRAMADAAIVAGAHGFIPKEASAEELNEAISQVMQGKKYVSPKIPRHTQRDGSAMDDPALDRLTPRHKQILRLIGAGKTSQQIADSLGVSHRTIEFHRASIRRALGITNEVGLLRYAVMLQGREGGIGSVTTAAGAGENAESANDL
ncbi:MAG: response regulator [Gemmatimonadaceae bacterium]